MNQLEARLGQLGLSLPAVEPPVANYIPYTRNGSLLFISGQIGRVAGAGTGPVGAGTSVEVANKDAQFAALKLLAVINSAVGGNLEQVEQVLRLGVFIAASSDFDGQSAVANGASDLLVAVFGERGRHARTSVGVASLPARAAVELDAVVRIREHTQP